MKLRTVMLALCLFLLAGCGNQSEPPVTEAGGTVENMTPADSPREEEPVDEPENLFESMPDTFMFCSGAGAWSTDLDLKTDGSFSGLFHDSDMGDMDPEKYPSGTVYICGFSGRFSQPERTGRDTYTMQLETLDLEHPGDETEEIIDGCRYIYSGPYGLEGAEELVIYGPDSNAEDLPEDLIMWIRSPFDWSPTEAGTLGRWVIYNVNEGYGFVQYPFGTEGN